MSRRVKPCPDCGGGVAWAAAPNGGRIRLDPHPDPAGKYRVDVLTHGLKLLAAEEASSNLTKRWDPHVCITARTAAPRGGRPQQLTLGDT